MRKNDRKQMGRSTLADQVGPPRVLNLLSDRAARNQRGLIVLIVIGLLARVALAAISWGSNDANTFYAFGVEVNQLGIGQAYQHDQDLNHPPLPVYWVLAAYKMTAARPEAFSFVFKLPTLLVEGATTWLLYKIFLKRAGPDRALAVAAMYSWCLDAILVSGFHCNTDPIYAFLCLLCVWLMEERDRYFLGGLALGAAVNIKLTPVLLAVPLLFNSRDWKRAALFVGGLSLGAVPFLPLLLGPGGVRAAFRANALAYNSVLDKWGIQFFLLPGGPNNMLPADFDLGPSAAGFYYYHGKFLVLALIGGWSVAARLLRRWSRYDLAAVTFALFLIFAPGFGVQYTVMLLPLMFASRPWPATVYGAAAGLFLLAVYFINWTGEWPLFSRFHSLLPMPSPWLGLLAWGALVAYVVIVLFRRAVPDPSGPR